MSTQFDLETKYLATGMRNGAIHVYNLNYGDIEMRIDSAEDKEKTLVDTGFLDVKYPVTWLKWQPRFGGTRSSGILAASYGNNVIKIWDCSRKEVKHTIVETGNTGVYTIDYNMSGSLLVSGGADATLRIYDDATKKCIHQYKPGLKDVVHHFNRIYCVKFNPEDDRIVYSGGADKVVTVHDTRIKDPLRLIIGPYIIGDCIDINNNSLLTGSYRSEECLEVWDLRNYERVSAYDWDKERPKRGGQIIAAKFTKGRANGIIAAGKALNDVKIFDRSSGESTAGISGFKSMIYSLDLSYEGSVISVGNADGTVCLLEYE